MRELRDLSTMCVHTITLKKWNIEYAAEKFSDAGIGGITVWRDALTGRDIRATGNMLRAKNLQIVSLCRGGFFPSPDETFRKAAIADNINAIDEAHELGAPVVVLVCGSSPSQSLQISREQIKSGIEACLAHAEKKNIILAIEPLHPMYAGDRSAINSLSQANDLAEYFNSPYVGIAVDVYHLWWDPELENQLKRCAAHGHLTAFHICDWMVPTTDLLNDRGLMGEGCINVKQIRGWVEACGFTGLNEVEIFSTRHWNSDQELYFKKIQEAYLSHS